MDETNTATEAQEDNQQHKVVVTCESNVDISVADDLYQHLKKALDEHQAVEIDAENVERVDTAILQLFYAFFKEAALTDLEVSWKSVSEAFKASADVLGLSKELQLT